MTKNSESKRPSYNAFQVDEGADDQSYFNRIGAAFAHKDGEGHTVVLSALPVDGRVVLRTPQERVEDTKSKRARRRSARDGYER